jgi:phosphoribosylformylglycinamidine cyclo-ligase
VNHSVNDILVHGARPIAFLDYIAGASVEEETLAALVEGVACGCSSHRMALVGGETALMPDLYQPGHYDLAGSIVGVVSGSSVLHSDRVQVGDALIGFESSGLHTNGYTLARQVMFDDLGLEIDSEVPGLGVTAGEALLAIHRSYWASVNPVLDRVHALAHITGGGIPGNLSRSLPDGRAAHLARSAWDVPPLFTVLQDGGDLEELEMYRVFNMGLGLIAIVESSDVQAVFDSAIAAGVKTWQVGEIVEGEGVQIVD